MTGRFQLERFVTAQDRVYADVLAELRAGANAPAWSSRHPRAALPSSSVIPTT